MDSSSKHDLENKLAAIFVGIFLQCLDLAVYIY